VTTATTGLPAPEAVRSRAASENFSVASLLLGPRTRDHLLAVYDFARYVDELGDSIDGDRIAVLHEAMRQLDLAFAGHATDPVFVQLTPTIHACALSRGPFLRLIEANRRDQVHHDYGTWDELLGYCELSANPVGELVLEVFGAKTPETLALSDDVCTALQVIEHLQDVGEDARNGRVYLPREHRSEFGVTVEDLHAPTASEPLRRLVSHEAERARTLLASGTRLVRALHGRARIAVAGYVGGGRAQLAALHEAGYDVLSSTPKASRGQRLRSTTALLLGVAR
jgi:squalene synthase HpnC